jgi:hypothetical protein
MTKYTYSRYLNEKEEELRRNRVFITYPKISLPSFGEGKQTLIEKIEDCLRSSILFGFRHEIGHITPEMV